MSKLVYSGVAALALAGIGWFGYHWQHGTSPLAALTGASEKGKSQAAGAGPNAPVPKNKSAPAGNARRGGPVGVTVAPVVRGVIEQRADVVGSLLAVQTILVRPEIDGRLREIMLTDGASVSEGDVMFRLDADVVDAQVAQAEAELELARSNLRRTRNLASQRFVSRRTRDEAQANVNVLSARMQVVRAQQARTVIRAPFAGTVGLVSVSTGDYVRAGESLVRLDDLSRLKVDLKVPEHLLARVRTGQNIRVRVDAYPDRPFTARVQTIDTLVDQAGRSVLVRGLLDNPGQLLRPGMFARASLVLAQRNDALLVPEASLIPGQGGTRVYLVSDDTARLVVVTTGVRQDGQVEITSGLSEGDRVVESGHIKLRGDNAAVRILSAASS